jgi:hypothetical protein
MTPEELYCLTAEEIERIRAEELYRLAAEAMDRLTSEELDAINSKLNRDNAEYYAKRQAAEEQALAQKLERAGLGDVDVMAALQSEAQAKVEAEERERAAARTVLDNMDMVRQALVEGAKDYIHTRQSAAASKPRKKKEKTTLSGEFIERMTSERHKDRSLPEFIDLALAGKIKDIGLKKHPTLPLAYLATAHAVPVESDDEAKGWKKRSHETLKEWWKKAGKII